jgi:hypothetical protein
MKADPVSENPCSSQYQTIDKVQPIIPSTVYHHQNHLESIFCAKWKLSSANSLTGSTLNMLCRPICNVMQQNTFFFVWKFQTIEKVLLVFNGKAGFSCLLWWCLGVLWPQQLSHCTFHFSVYHQQRSIILNMLKFYMQLKLHKRYHPLCYKHNQQQQY